MGTNTDARFLSLRCLFPAPLSSLPRKLQPRAGQSFVKLGRGGTEPDRSWVSIRFAPNELCHRWRLAPPAPPPCKAAAEFNRPRHPEGSCRASDSKGAAIATSSPRYPCLRFSVFQTCGRPSMPLHIAFTFRSAFPQFSEPARPLPYMRFAFAEYYHK